MSGAVDIDPCAICIGCGCDDTDACEGGCQWLAVDYQLAIGVCSRCPEALSEFQEAEDEIDIEDDPGGVTVGELLARIKAWGDAHDRRGSVTLFSDGNGWIRLDGGELIQFGDLVELWRALERLESMDSVNDSLA